MNKALPGHAAAKPDRKAHLREYILACIGENVLSFSDLAHPGVIDKLLKCLGSDIRAVLKDLGKNGGANALRIAAMKFMQFAEGLNR